MGPYTYCDTPTFQEMYKILNKEKRHLVLFDSTKT